MKTTSFVLLLILAALVGGAGGWAASALTGKSATTTATTQTTSAARQTQQTTTQQASGQSTTTQSVGQQTIVPGGGTSLFGGATFGTIARVEGNLVTLTTRDGSTATVHVSDTTSIQKTGQGTTSDLVAGVAISVSGTASAGAIQATSVSITSSASALGMGQQGGFSGGPGGVMGGTSGTIAKVEGNTVTLTARDGSTVKVLVSGTTVIQKTVPGSINDLTAGGSITVMGEKQSDGSINATSIVLTPAFRSQQ